MEYTHVEVLQKLGPEIYVIPCAFCVHKGRLPTMMHGWIVREWSHLDECPVCDGQGMLEIKSPDLPIHDAYCDGTGHEPHDTSEGGMAGKRCHKCDGLGARSLRGKITVLSPPRS